MPRYRRKKTHSGKNFKFFIWSIIVTIIVFIKINEAPQPDKTESQLTRNKIVKNKISPVVTRVNEKLNQAVHLEKKKKFTEAIAVLNSATREINLSTEFSDQFKSYVWDLKTNLHLRLWQYADAKEAITEALRFADKGQKKNLIKKSDWLENVIEKVNKERNKNTSYLASPNVGPAANFFGDIGIVHLFVEEKTSKSWGLKQRSISLTAMNKAKKWFKKETYKYGKSVNFKQRVYLINRNPAIKRLSLATDKKRYRYANAIVDLAVKQLGGKSILSFLYAQKKAMQVNEVMLLVHINKSGRSFAKRCLFKCATTGEYTYILEDASVKKWQSMEYAQAHESLHLFGADDLYNIKQSIYFATRDIMNYPSKYLDASVIEPVTAYGIGLINKKPEAPFKIKTIKY